MEQGGLRGHFPNSSSCRGAATMAQLAFEADPSPEYRSSLNKTAAEFVLRVRMEEDFWRQKATFKWVVEGERNSKYFQGWVKQKRTKAKVHEIRVGNRILEEESNIRSSVEIFFHDLLAPDNPLMLGEPDLDILHRLPPETNLDILCATPEEEEVKVAMWNISSDSASGPDGISSLFFQSCW